MLINFKGNSCFSKKIIKSELQITPKDGFYRYIHFTWQVYLR